MKEETISKLAKVGSAMIIGSIGCSILMGTTFTGGWSAVWLLIVGLFTCGGLLIIGTICSIIAALNGYNGCFFYAFHLILSILYCLVGIRTTMELCRRLQYNINISQFLVDYWFFELIGILGILMFLSLMKRPRS